MNRWKPISPRKEIVLRLLIWAGLLYLWLSDAMVPLAPGEPGSGIDALVSWNRHLGDLASLTTDFFRWIGGFAIADWLFRRAARKSREQATRG
jgi:hypothetical protein